MSNKWRYAYPLMLWSSLNTLLNIIFALVIYRAHSWEFREGVLTAIAGTKKGRTRILGRPGAQGWGGLFVCYASGERRSRADLRVHENCHVVQGLVLGPLFLVVYVLMFLAIFAYVRNWKTAYRLSPFEEQAYKRQAAYYLTSNDGAWAQSRWGHGD